MPKDEHYDIAIIGRGITGLSSAYHLSLDPKLKICLSGTDETTTSQVSGNLATGGLIDNYTRITQRHGAERAKAAWLYSNHAFDAVLAFAKEQGISAKQGTRHRLIETEDELTECKKAVEELKGAGFPSQLQKELPKGAAHLLAQQIDGERAAAIDSQALLNKLNELTQKIARVAPVVSFERVSQHFLVKTEKGSFTAEVLVLANHLGIPKLLPGLSEVLVSSQDQYLRMKTGGKTLPFAVGSVLSWRHGHYWASVEASDQITLGGARFFRPLAGFEQSQAELSPKISSHLPEAWAKYFPEVSLVEKVDEKAGLDIRPCDEIPVIGPMFGETGIFLAAGYMGQGLSLGFKAGQSLAKLVLGKADELPRFFWPERHRSLASEN